MVRRAVLALTVVLLSFGFALLLGEVAVRVLEQRRELGAARRARYEEAYQAKAFRKGGLGPGGYLAEGFRGYVSDEFGQPVEWINNGQGFRRREETRPEPPPGTLRILYLGDSFVAGHRAGQDESFGALLEQGLRREGFPGAEVLLSAVEEPVRALDYLETRGLAWHPRVVLLGLTLGNDLAQVHFNLGPHGAFRLRPDDGGRGIEPNPAADDAAQLALIHDALIPPDALSGSRKPAPAYLLPPTAPEAGPVAPLHLLHFARSWIRDRSQRSAPQAILSVWGDYAQPRLFDGNGLGISLEPSPPEIEQTYGELEALLLRFRRVCDRHGLMCAVTPFAQRFQVQPEDWRETAEVYGLRPERFDLRAPNRKIAEIAARVGLADIDSTERLAARYVKEGWPLYMPRGDMHWNRAGQRAYAEETLAALLDFLGQAARPGGAPQTPQPSFPAATR